MMGKKKKKPPKYIVPFSKGGDIIYNVPVQ